MSSVELSLQLQIQDIAAVQQAYVASVMGRDPNTLWWLADSSENIVYENRVKGSSLSAIDANVTNVKIGSTIFGDWFNLQNTYFSQDQPIAGVQSLKQAIETKYRWRVSQYFNDVAKTGGSTISPLYVFPYPDFNLGIVEVTGGTVEYTKGVGPVDLTVTGPGILALISSAETVGPVAMDLNVVYPDNTLGTIHESVTGASETIDVGKVLVTHAYTAADPSNSIPGDLGVVQVGSTTNFRVGTTTPNLVVIMEDAGTTPSSMKTEVAEIVSIGTSPTSLTLRQPTPPGAAAPFSPGLRNSYSTTAKVYPLFIDVKAIANATGTNDGDQVQVSFYPDCPQGFVDVTGIEHPQ